MLLACRLWSSSRSAPLRSSQFFYDRKATDLQLTLKEFSPLSLYILIKIIKINCCVIYFILLHHRDLWRVCLPHLLAKK